MLTATHSVLRLQRVFVVGKVIFLSLEVSAVLT